MRGTLSPRCAKCHTHITWEKVHFLREDLYPDWTILVYCDCGIVTDHEIHKAARADYDQKNANVIYAEQEENLRKACPNLAGRLGG